MEIPSCWHNTSRYMFISKSLDKNSQKNAIYMFLCIYYNLAFWFNYSNDMRSTWSDLKHINLFVCLRKEMSSAKLTEGLTVPVEIKHNAFGQYTVDNVILDKTFLYSSLHLKFFTSVAQWFVNGFMPWCCWNTYHFMPTEICYHSNKLERISYELNKCKPKLCVFITLTECMKYTAFFA